MLDMSDSKAGREPNSVNADCDENADGVGKSRAGGQAICNRILRQVPRVGFFRRNRVLQEVQSQASLWLRIPMLPEHWTGFRSRNLARHSELHHR